MVFIKMRWRILLFLLCVNIQQALSQGQTSEQTFGQNRVQYKDFVWSYFQTDRFIAYFYLGGQELGKFTIVDAEKEMNDIEQRLEYKMNDRIEILIYNNLDDLKQTNIGYG